MKNKLLLASMAALLVTLHGLPEATWGMDGKSNQEDPDKNGKKSKPTAAVPGSAQSQSQERLTREQLREVRAAKLAAKTTAVPDQAAAAGTSSGLTLEEQEAADRARTIAGLSSGSAARINPLFGSRIGQEQPTASMMQRAILQTSSGHEHDEASEKKQLLNDLRILLLRLEEECPDPASGGLTPTIDQNMELYADYSVEELKTQIALTKRTLSNLQGVSLSRNASSSSMSSLGADEGGAYEGASVAHAANLYFSDVLTEKEEAAFLRARRALDVKPSISDNRSQASHQGSSLPVENRGPASGKKSKSKQLLVPDDYESDEGAPRSSSLEAVSKPRSQGNAHQRNLSLGGHDLHRQSHLGGPVSQGNASAAAASGSGSNRSLLSNFNSAVDDSSENGEPFAAAPRPVAVDTHGDRLNYNGNLDEDAALARAFQASLESENRSAFPASHAGNSSSGAASSVRAPIPAYMDTLVDSRSVDAQNRAAILQILERTRAAGRNQGLVDYEKAMSRIGVAQGQMQFTDFNVAETALLQEARDALVKAARPLGIDARGLDDTALIAAIEKAHLKERIIPNVIFVSKNLLKTRNYTDQRINALFKELGLID